MYELNCVIKVTYVIAGVITIFMFLMSTLLSSCTEGKNLKTFFEIDKEFENMMTVMKSNFVTVDSFDSSMRVSLRQTLIDRCVYRLSKFECPYNLVLDPQDRLS